MDELELLRLRRDSQERPPLYYCRGCGGEIYPGDEYYGIGGKRLCRECVEFARCYAEEGDEVPFFECTKV